MRVVDLHGNELFASLISMDTFGQRLKGLLFRNSISKSDAFWFDRCSSVHMFGMTFSIDAIFLDRDFKVVKVHKELRPWQVAWSWRGHSVLEVCAGQSDQLHITVGQRLRFIEHV
ncbi:DUF192 domain-containing protein [Arenicella xantha]|uniref:DUF192 domain-containing protein n=1 Tax=Arenicella xantha TaxID=644221 RepID=A0A395JKP9_9GAMM|nr:DUF192 domain-containing protein [Arenicella xantha]RBP51376.1 hypothetical protein DFR28_102796 [Arenicella xantha]